MNFLRSKRGTSEVHVVKRKPAHVDSAINLSETDGPLHDQAKKGVDNKDMTKVASVCIRGFKLHAEVYYYHCAGSQYGI